MASTARVALGMSGGVDSSVSAVLLARAGYEVVGVTCLFHDDDASQQAAEDAGQVCDSLGIRHVVADCTAAFEERVVRPFVSAYESGLTPSPCIRCNAVCKVPALMEVADQFSCDKVATGHYARIAQLQEDGRFVVKTGLDERKDQSYMLALLSQDQLGRLVLPLGAMTKTDVRLLAQERGLGVAQAPDSQDICFIDGDYRDFLHARGVGDEPGAIVTVDGEVVGSHTGLAGFTVGQRKGIGVAGPEPYYVVEKRPDTRELVIGTADQARIGSVRVAGMTWQAFDRLEAAREATVKLRYRSSPVACIIEPEGNDSVRVRLHRPQPTTAPGQFAVFYEGSTVLGGGMIEEVAQL